MSDQQMGFIGLCQADNHLPHLNKQTVNLR